MPVVQSPTYTASSGPRVSATGFVRPARNGTAVPVGSQAAYVYVSQHPNSMPFSYSGRYGTQTLPNGDWGGRPQFEHLDFGPLSGW